MARRQIKLDDLSDTTGIPKSTLSTKLRGGSDFSVPELIEIAAALDVSAASLLPADLDEQVPA